MKILVTGGSGFIGSHLVPVLSKNHEVFNLDIVKPNFESNAKFINCDIRNYEKLQDLFNQNISTLDVIIHLAALTREQMYGKEESYFKTNVEGTLNLLKLAQKNNIKKFIFPSSYLAYGNQKKFPVKESIMLKSEGVYASTKVVGEALCNSFSQMFGMNIIIFRQAIVYGKNDLQKRVVALFIDLAKKGKNLTVFGNKILDLVHIEDVIDAYKAALNYEKSDVFNIASGKERYLLELAQNVKKIINNNIKIIEDSPKEGDIIKFVADISKAKHLLGFNPQGSLVKFIESERG